MTTNIQPNFKGSFTRTENGTPYYKTNAGVKAGGVVAGLEALGGCYSFVKKNKSEGIRGLALAGLSLGCGAAVDYIRNKKAQETADTVKQIGLRNAAMNNPNIELSDSGRAFYHSKDGLKYGGLLGAGVGLISGLLYSPKEFAKELGKEAKNMPKISKATYVLSSIVVTSIGGLIMGAIADHFNNSSASKNS